MPRISRGDADLRDVAALRRHQAGERDPAQTPRIRFESRERRRAEEDPAAGKLNDIEKKAPRAHHAAVLIVDAAIECPLRRRN